MTININLLPWREERKKQVQQEFMVLAGLCSALALTIMAGIHFIFMQQISAQLDLNNYLKQEIAELDKKIAEIDNIQKEKERLLARMNIIQELQTNRPNVVRLFDNLVRTIPDGLFLLSLTRQNLDISIEGKAESNTRVSNFMRNIEASDWLAKPVLSVIEADDKKDKDSMIAFTLQAVQVEKGN